MIRSRRHRVLWLALSCAGGLLLLPGASRPQAPVAPDPPPASAGQAPVALVASPASAAAPLAAVPAGPDPGFLDQFTATLRFTLGTPQAIQVAPGGPAGPAVLFLRSAPRSFVRDLYEYQFKETGEEGGQEHLLASAQQLLGGADERLSPEEKAERERQRLSARGIATYDLSEDGTKILVPLSGRLFLIDRSARAGGGNGAGAVRELPAAGGHPLDARLSPDGTRVACVRDGDLHVIDLATGAQRRLTTGATATLTHGLAEFVAQEEMGRREGYWWSPDSRTLAYEESDTSRVELFHIADPMHPERAADAWPYPRPGRDNAVVRLGLVPAAGGATVWVAWDRARYPYLAAVRWQRGGPLTLLVQNREQTEELLLAADPATGATRTLLAESDAAWLNLHASVPRWLDDGGGLLWISERTGEPRLELRAPDGTPRRWLTPEGFGLRSLAGLDAAGGWAYVVASADPTAEQLWRVPLDGRGEPAALTREPGIHAGFFARDGSAAVWSASPLSGERSWSVRRRDGSEAGRLRSVAERPPFFSRLELTTLGPLGFRAALIRPRAFTPDQPPIAGRAATGPAARKLPVLVSVYAGPHVQTVRSDAWAGQYLLDQWIADHGFAVLTLDGRGTPGRGRAWERAIKGNLIDVQLADQVAGLQAAAARYPELDLARTGIFGWSFGGYFAAMAAMRRPDVYHAAVAGAPVCDWLDYDTHYTERYLGLPQANPDGYRQSSVLTWCPRLRVPLLVVHGTADDNVYFMNSLKLTDALFRAGRPYDFLVLPGFTHMVPDAAVQRALQERIVAFFAAHLGAQSPRF
ncbi:MAG TPA: DPP IV N-terminal domain-containing protein [Thermoanaerobaculia bacterium]|nr:DPP IV N-terminal domain-containing protein [Thermoanaerobaculia bacterium]